MRAGVMQSEALQAKNLNEQQNSTLTVAAGQETKANATRTLLPSNPTDSWTIGMDQEKF